MLALQAHGQNLLHMSDHAHHLLKTLSYLITHMTVVKSGKRNQMMLRRLIAQMAMTKVKVVQ